MKFAERRDPVKMAILGQVYTKPVVPRNDKGHARFDLIHDELVEYIKREHIEGSMNFHQLASSLEVHNNMLSRYLDKHGVEYHKQKVRERLSKAQREELKYQAKDLALQGYPQHVIGKKLGFHVDTIHKWLREDQEYEH